MEEPRAGAEAVSASAFSEAECGWNGAGKNDELRMMKKHWGVGSHGTVFVPWVFPGQNPFWDRFVRHAKEFAERLDPIHLNPVRQGLVAKPQDRPWSSCNNYALGKKTVAAPIAD